jgi:GT2 family glycosyltransferase
VSEARLPAASVVIPTHNRRDSLDLLLTALERQTVAADLFETIVVADGCVDDTIAFVRSRTTPYRLRLVELPGLGAASARNRGAAAAQGAVLVFVDDDIEPVPELVEAYLDEHRSEPGRLLIGCSLPVVEVKTFYEKELRRWWQDHILAMQHVSHRFGYRDMHAGNFSIAARTFAEVGGFDEAFPGCGGEDYELGVRLLEHGVQFGYCRSAEGRHHDDTDLDRSLRRAFQEGRADVLIAERHPRLVPELQNRIIGARRAPRFGNVRAWLRRRWVGALDWGNLHGRALRSYGRLRAYSYERGAAFQLAGGGSRIYGASVGGDTLLDLDLREGLHAAMRTLDEARPAGARIRHGNVEIAVLDAEPGLEPVRGRHLAGALIGSAKLLNALVVNVIETGGERPSWARRDRGEGAARTLLLDGPPTNVERSLRAGAGSGA